MATTYSKGRSLLIFTIIIGLLNVFIFLPYASVLFFALIFSVVTRPLYVYFKKNIGGKGNVAAFLSVCSVVILIVGPAFFGGSLLLREASDLYQTIASSGKGPAYIDAAANSAEEYISTFLPQGSSVNLNVEQILTQGLSWIVENLSILVSSFIKIFFGVVLMLIALFYFLRDGHKFIDSFMRLSPLPEASNTLILKRINGAVQSVFFGDIVIALIQGIFVAFGFSIFGVPSPAIWGFLAAIASLIPMLGTGIITAPVAVVLFLSGNVSSTIGVILWGVLAVGLIDDLLRPQFIERGMHVHPLLILISALGGLATFGIVGFLAGPVLLALFFTLLDLYPLVGAASSRRRTTSTKKKA